MFRIFRGWEGEVESAALQSPDPKMFRIFRRILPNIQLAVPRSARKLA